MVSVLLTAYSIRIRVRRGRKDLPLGEFIKGQDLLPYLFQSIQNLKNKAWKAPQKPKLIRGVRVHNKAGAVYGIAAAGTYGRGSAIYDTVAGNDTYERKSHDADLVPLYFKMYVPKKGNVGLAIFQSFNETSIKDVLTQYLEHLFVHDFPDHSIYFSKLMPEAVVKQILRKHKPKAIRFIRFALTPDIADAIGLKKNVAQQEGTLELIYKAKTKFDRPILTRIDEVISGTRNPNKILELKNFPHDTTKLQIDMDGKLRTINLGQFGATRSSFDISNDVDFAPNGHPKYRDVVKVTDDLAKQLMKHAGIRLDR